MQLSDKWILTRYQETVARDHRQSRKATSSASPPPSCYDFIWATFCDWYIEIAKQGLYADERERKRTTQEVLLYVLTGTLKLLHPYMPFITEEVYGYLPGHEGMLITAQWPEVKPEYDFPAEAAPHGGRDGGHPHHTQPAR